MASGVRGDSVVSQNDPSAVLRAYPNTMIPLDRGRTFEELLASALYNCDTFDKIPMDGQLALGDGKPLLRPITWRKRFEDGLAGLALKRGWTYEQCVQVRELYRKAPPDRIYRVRGGFHSLTRGIAPIGTILSYRPGKRGDPAQAAIVVLGFNPDVDFDLGSQANPLPVPLEGLEDVTEAARARTLPELKAAEGTL